MKSPTIIGILGLPLILCSCFPWSPISQNSWKWPELHIQSSWTTSQLDKQVTILGYFPSVNCSFPQILKLEASLPWNSAYQMTCPIKDKSKAQEELAYIKKVFSAPWSEFWPWFTFSPNQTAVADISGDSMIFKITKTPDLNSSQPEYFLKNIEESYKMERRIEKNLWDITSSNIAFSEAQKTYPQWIQAVLNKMKSPDTKVITSSAFGFQFTDLSLDSAFLWWKYSGEQNPFPNHHIIWVGGIDIWWEYYALSIIYTWEKIEEKDVSKKLAFLQNPISAIFVYAENTSERKSFIFNPEIIK